MSADAIWLRAVDDSTERNTSINSGETGGKEAQQWVQGPRPVWVGPVYICSLVLLKFWKFDGFKEHAEDSLATELLNWGSIIEQNLESECHTWWMKALDIPATSAGSERMFSRVIEECRNSRKQFYQNKVNAVRITFNISIVRFGVKAI